MNTNNNKQIGLFFLLTFAFSWILWSPFTLPGLGIVELPDNILALRTVAIFIGAFSPLFAAVALVIRQHGRQGIWPFLRRGFDLRLKPIYLILALLLPLLITAVAHYAANLTGIDNFPPSLLPDDLPVPTFLLIIPYFFLMLILGGGQEEFGWRGYAQEPLQERFGFLKGSVILGLIWGVWHLPLWLMPGEGHTYYSFWAFLIFTTSTAVIIAWLYNASGKKLVVAWFYHAMSNTAVPFFPILHLEDVPQPGYWLRVGLNAVVAIMVAIWFLKRSKTI